MIEDHKRLVSRVAKFQSALDALLGSIMAQDERTEARLTALETRPCSPDSSASPAAASAGSGGTAHADSAAPRTVSGADTGNDPTAAIRADPRRPKWLTDACLPLPPGVDRVYPGWAAGEVCGLAAYPGRHWMCLSNLGVWERDQANCEQDRRGPDAEVYHVPQPAPADFTTPVQTGEVLYFSVDSQPAPGANELYQGDPSMFTSKPTILPPAEMPEALRPYWTPESRVYIDWARSVCVYPSQMATIASVGIPFKTVHSEAKVVDKNCTLLPNRTTESILGTASAAKAVEQGVADAVEGRTVEVSVTKTKHEALYDAARRYVESGRYEPDSKIQQDLAEAVRQLTPHRADQAKIPEPLDQLAAEAQAEGEYGTAWKFENCKFVHDGHANVTRCQPPTPRRTAREVAEEIVKRWLAYGATSPGTAQQLMASITAAIERDREGR